MQMRLTDHGASKSHPVESGTEQYSMRYLVYAIILIALANVFNAMDRNLLSIVLQPVKEDLLLTDTQMGLLTGFAFSLFYACFAIPVARWGDRGIRRSILSLALTVWSLATAMTGLCQNFIHFLLSRIGLGLGQAGGFSISNALISDYFSIERRSLAMGAFMVGGIFGGLLGMIGGGWITEYYGWRAAFIAAGLPGLGLAVLIRLTMREPSRGHADGIVNAEAPPPMLEAIGRLWRKKSYKHILIGFAISSMTGSGIRLWMPAFLMRHLDLTVAQVGLSIGIASGVGAVIGIIGGGILANYLIRREVRWILWLAIIVFLLNVPSNLVIIFSTYPMLIYTVVFFVSLLGGAVFPSILALLQGVAPANLRALAAALVTFATNALGAGAGPMVVGVLSDLLTPHVGEVRSLQYALLVMTILTLATIPSFYLASKTLSHDLPAAHDSQTP